MRSHPPCGFEICRTPPSTFLFLTYSLVKELTAKRCRRLSTLGLQADVRVAIAALWVTFGAKQSAVCSGAALVGERYIGCGPSNCQSTFFIFFIFLTALKKSPGTPGKCSRETAFLTAGFVLRGQKNPAADSLQDRPAGLAFSDGVRDTLNGPYL